MSTLWDQTTAFNFPSDRERNPARVMAPRRAVLPSPHLKPSGIVIGNSRAPHHLLDDTASQERIERSGICFHLPEWLPSRTDDTALAFVAAAIFAMYKKCGGDDAVLVIDGCPPTAMLNPCSLAPLQDEPFSEIVSDVMLKCDQSNRVADESRRSVAARLSPQTVIGAGAILRGRTIDRVGIDVFSQGFEVLWVLDYEGSKARVCNLDVYFNSSVFKDFSATSWLQMIQTILHTTELDKKTLSETSVLDDAMVDTLLVDWQPQQFPYVEYNRTIVDVFRDTLESRCRDPMTDLCVIDPFQKKQLTYQEVDEWSDQVAVYLQTEVCATQIDRFGVDAAIALHMPRSAEWYVWMLGILKAGAAYLSLDPDFPANRLSYILEDSGAVCLVTKSDMVGNLDYHGSVVAIDVVEEKIRSIDLSEKKVACLTSPTSPVYMIYTSGSTGKPKGVLVEHRNLVNFVLSERVLFQLGNGHRVIQGFSTSFDASLEEIWLAFASGSALICVTKAVMKDAEQLQELIAQTGATVLSTVPTLLATMDAKMLSALELVIVGGEACNKEVIEAYATGGKRMFVNSYGPTEATVACCAAFCKRGEPVTIGRAQPGYVAYIVDEGLRLLPPGIPGELCIGGPSVTRGYVNRPELTKEKFVPCPFHDQYDRMYRTGDLCRWNAEGNIEFLGRIDSQVKLRGFRIEIGEIETNLATFPGVTTAVVALRSDEGGLPFLCAYLICEPELEVRFKESAFRDHLKGNLPSYMIPSRFCSVKGIPRSPAGKLDRNGFPPPPPLEEAPVSNDGAGTKRPSTATEIFLHEVWMKHLPGQSFGVTCNFFEIGGHSLLAGKVASDIRKGGYDGFSIRYLYSNPTIESLAEAIDKMKSLRKSEPISIHLPFRQPPGPLRRLIFAIIQVLVMHLVFCVVSSSILVFLYLYSRYYEQMERAGPLWSYTIQAVALTVAGIAVGLTYTFILMPVIKWTVIGRFRPGVHSIWSWYFLRWWAVRALCGLVPLYFFSGTFWGNLYLRLMGMKLGRGVYYFPGTAYDFDLIEVGADSSIGHESTLLASEVVDGLLILRPIRIGFSTSIGVRCCVKGGASIGNESKLQHVSLVTEHQTIGSNELWGGSPSQKLGRTPTLATMLPNEYSDMMSSQHQVTAVNERDEESNEQTSLLGKSDNIPPSMRCTPIAYEEQRSKTAVRPSVLTDVTVAAVSFLWSQILFAVNAIPLFTASIAMWTYLNSMTAKNFPLVLCVCFAGAPFVVAAILLYSHAIIVVLRWIILPWKVEPGDYPASGLMFHRKIFFDLIMRTSLTIAHPLYASIYVQFLLKLLGTEVGKRVECSNLYGFTPGLTKLGSETFVADFVGVNPPEIFRGVMHLGKCEVKNRAFVGNGAVLPAGRTLHERSLLGLLSFPTRDLEAGSTYIGSPAFHIPRQAHTDKEGDSTYSASCGLILARCMWEFMRTVTPASCLLISLIIAWGVITVAIDDIFDWLSFAKLVSLMVWISLFMNFVMIAVIKWVIVGREQPSRYPLWSSGVWKAEFVVDCTTVIGGTAFLQLLRGTPFISWFFRILGAKIGKDCFIDTIFFTEPDMVTVGDNCCIGDRVTIQTHLFEDRIMKIEPLCISDRVSIGPMSIVLYNTTMERGCTIGALSLVMKGEAYPGGTHWGGIPAQRCGIPSVMAVAPPSQKIPRSVASPPPTKRESRPSSVRPQATVDTAPLKQWLLDDGLDGVPQDPFF